MAALSGNPNLYGEEVPMLAKDCNAGDRIVRDGDRYLVTEKEKSGRLKVQLKGKRLPANRGKPVIKHIAPDEHVQRV